MFSTALQSPFAIVLLLTGATLIVLAGLRLMADLLAPILLAYTMAVSLLPMVKRLEQRGLSRSLALAGVFLTAFVFAGVAVGFFLVELQQLASRIPSYQGMLESRFAQLEVLAGRMGYNLGDLLAGDRVIRASLGLISRLLNLTASLMIFLLILLTMTFDFPGVSRAFYGHSGNKEALSRQVRGLLADIQTHYRLQTVSNLVSAVAVTAAYMVFRVDFALLWGLSTFLLSYIPRFGMLLSFIPPLLMAFVQYGIERALALLLVSILLNGLMDNFVAPMLSRRGLALRTSTVLLSSLVWIWVFGPLGALLAVPMTLVVRRLLESAEQTMPLAYAISTEDYTPASPRGDTEGSPRDAEGPDSDREQE